MKQREIKFRAWQNKPALKKMWSWSELQMLSMADFTREDLVFMQFTGLKDIVGIDIYEGDIAHISIMDVGWVNCEVVHLPDSGGYAFHKLNPVQAVRANPSENWSMLISNKFEVIGNIYENPELIKA